MADLTVTSAVDTFMAAANQDAMLAALNITLGGAFSTSGSFSTTLTITGNTNVTLPTSGTLAILGANTFTGAQTIASGTITSSVTALSITQTWNNAAVSFQGPKITITDTASSISEEYFGIYGGSTGTTKLFSIAKIAGGNLAELVALRSTSNTWSLDFSAIGLSLGSARRLSWSSTVNYYDSNDLYLSRKAAATLQLGLDAAGVVDQMITAASRITSNGAGANLTLAGGNCRGTTGEGGVGGSLILATYAASGTTNTIGTLTTRITITTTGAIILAALPTSDPGVSGQLYKNAGVVMQSA